MKFYKLVNLLLERNIYYKPPKDKEQLLYDFYMLQGLQHPKDEKLEASYKEARETIANHLQKEMLEILFFAITAEFRHIQRHSNYQPYDDKTFTDKENQIIRTFMSKFFDHDTSADVDSNSKQKIKKKIDRTYKEDKNSYKKAYEAALLTIKSQHITKEDFVKLAKKAFSKLIWNEEYGGDAWAKIADGWLRLNNAKTLSEKEIAIDHVYDLQHNSDTVFNKVKSYYKENKFYTWLSFGLDKKSLIHDPFEIYQDVSPQMKTLAGFIIKNVTGMDWNLYWSKGKGKKDKERLKLDMVKKDPENIQYIKNPSKELQSLAIKKDIFTVNLIKNLDPELQMQIVKNSPYRISYINNPIEKVQMYAVKQDLSNIQDINNPTEKVQMYVVKQKPQYIIRINNPTDKVREYAKNH